MGIFFFVIINTKDGQKIKIRIRIYGGFCYGSVINSSLRIICCHVYR